MRFARVEVNRASFPVSIKLLAGIALVVVVALATGIYYVAGLAKDPSPTVAPSQPIDSTPSQPPAVAMNSAGTGSPASQAPAKAQLVAPESPGPAIADDAQPTPDATASRQSADTHPTETNAKEPLQLEETGGQPTPTAEAPTAPLAPVDADATPATVVPDVTVQAVEPDVSSGGSGQADRFTDDNLPTPDPAPQTSGSGSDDQVQFAPQKSSPKYPNLSTHLNQLVADLESGQSTADKAAQSAPLFSDESVAVTIYLSDRVDDMVTFLEDNGGDPRNVGVDYIEAYVPVPLMGPVSEQPGVLRVREIVPPQGASQSRTGAPGRP